MKDSQTIKLGVLGLGTVGGGLVTVLKKNAEVIRRRVGSSIEVEIASVRDLSAQRICDCSGIRLTDDPFEVVSHDDVDIVLELMGGVELAKDLVLKAIELGKHVVTANKALIAVHGNEIFSFADEHGVSVLFEASVAGGIDIIKGLREGLAGNEVELVAGIINGTGNFILTGMRDSGRSFKDVLAEAQQLGYAEADPTFDVEGVDAAHKLTILASLAYGTPLDFDSVFIEGMSSIDLLDIELAKSLGFEIKHLGIARRFCDAEDKLEIRVHPTLVPENHLLANVDGVMNAIVVRGNAVGETLKVGAGAGAEPTASAVLADVVDLCRNRGHAVIPHLGFKPEEIRRKEICASKEFRSAYYMRAETTADGSLDVGTLKAVFAKYKVELAEKVGRRNSSLAVVTESTTESQFLMALAELNSVIKVVAWIRVEHFKR